MSQTTGQSDDIAPDSSLNERKTAPGRVLIRASAGTGKTFRLSNWFIAELFDSDDTAEILATTFTRKAAREILDRVLVRLAAAALDESRCQELAGFINRPVTREQCLTLLGRMTNELHRIRVSTLDSFFAQIATNCSLDLGLPPGWAIIDGNSDRELKREAIEVMLREEGQQLATQLQQMTVGDSNRSVTRLIDAAIGSSYPTYLDSSQSAWSKFPEYHPLGSDRLVAAMAGLESMALPQTSKGEPNKTWQKARDKALAAVAAEDWEALIQNGLVSRILTDEASYARKPIEPPVRAAFQQLISHARGVIIPQMARQTAALWNLLDQFHTVYTRMKHDRRWLTHSDVTRHLAAAVSRLQLNQIAFRLDSRLHHLLLDEFQDTSLVQWNILEPFARQVTQDRPGHTFFCVGDAKQAIYSWRGGVAEIFDKVQSQISGLQETSLLESRRSSPAIIDTVNQLFGTDRLSELPALSTAEARAVEEWCAHYGEHSTFLNTLPGYCELRTAPAAGESAIRDSPASTSTGAQKQATLAAAADRIAALAVKTPHSTIGVLCRSNATIARIMFELQERRVPASEEGGNPLTDSAAVESILSLLTIADHPGDSAARFHVATSPLGRLFDFEDHADIAAGHQLSRQIRRELAGHGLHQTLESWCRRLHPFCSPRDARRLEQLVALSARTQSARDIRTRPFIDVVRNERIQDPSAHRIRVMTIHKSKGLEFDIVILPELDADLHGATPGVVVGRQAPTEPVDCVSIYRKKEIQKLLSADFQAAFSNWTGDAVTQSLCVLYVAITRARHACYMLIPPATGKSDTLRSTLSGLLRKGLTESGTRAEPDTLLFQTGNPDWYLQVDDPKSNAGRVPAAAQQPSPIRLAPMPDGRQRGLITVIPSELEGGRTVRIHELLSLDRAERLERGTLLHRWFEEIRWLDEGLPDEQRLRSIAGLHGFQGAHIEAELARFRSFLQNPTIVSLLSQQAFEGACPPDLSADVCGLINSSRIRLEVHCEWGFTAPGTEGSLTTGIIDRLVLIFDAECHELLAVDIIDYKTDEIADGQLAADTRAGFYTHQMQAYRSAIQNLYRIPQNRISARLLFVTTGTVCAVPAGQDHSDH